MMRTCFNPAQQHLLKMFERTRSEQDLEELKSVLMKYYAKKVEVLTDQLWDDGILDGKAIEDILNEHLRTPYK